MARSSEPGARERRHDALRREYSRLAPRYDTRWARYVAATLEATLARMAVEPGERVLDVACGTGALLAAIARRCPEARLTGIDSTPGMLDAARRRLGAGHHLCAGRSDPLPFADGAFDLVVSTSALHYFTDPAAALAEMRRVLAPDGRLVITDWCTDHLPVRLLDLWLRRVSPAYHAAYEARSLEQMLRAAGFAAVTVERYRIDWFWGMMTACARVRPAPGAR